MKKGREISERMKNARAAGLIFSGLAMKAKSNGGSGIGWGILSLLCIAFFGYMGYAIYFTSSPSVDSFWYYF